MKFSPIVLSLLSSAIAVDLRFVFGTSCDPKWPSLQCTGWNPDALCFMPNNQGTGTVWIAAVPENWYIYTNGYNDQHGGNQIGFAQGQGDGCIGIHDPTIGVYESAQYSFHAPSKMARSSAPEEGASSAAGTSSQRVNTMVNTDGTKYSIKHLGDDDLECLIEQAKNGTVSQAIEQFNLSPKI